MTHKSKNLTKVLTLTGGLFTFTTFNFLNIALKNTSNNIFDAIENFEYLNSVFEQKNFSKHSFLLDNLENNKELSINENLNYVQNSSNLNYKILTNNVVEWTADFNSNYTYEEDGEKKYASNPYFVIFISDDLKINKNIKLKVKNSFNNSLSEINFNLPEINNENWEGNLEIWKNQSNSLTLKKIQTYSKNNYY
ncbi:hypothetical protein [Mycoplasmopsis columbina]|uniref:hypothetical protein n=1 Tax=Mycoplasmopsis columbina TaxID=114881 RepID=UPI0004A6AEA0|nr:hypothetical protein [Mycoplasmopsis columbina]VEU76913.1 Uncharacterised protein [Mycoplasmopsis columbina]